MVSIFTAAASITAVLCVSFTSGFVSEQRQVQTNVCGRTRSTSMLTAVAHSQEDDTDQVDTYNQNRRSFLARSFMATLGIATSFNGGSIDCAVAADGQLNDILAQIKEGRTQLESIPDLIKDEKWDAARAILVKPPLSNMWTSGGQNKLLNNYADAIGNELPDGDEMAALELREEVISHLRYLDMAVYNNVFNPIGSEGTSGATKELVRSYYEDPTNEWKASASALDALIGLASK